VYLIDQSLEVHRHRVPTTAGGVASPGRAFAGASIEKRDGAGGADGGGGRTCAASSDARLGLPAGGVVFDEEAAPRFIDPRRR